MVYRCWPKNSTWYYSLNGANNMETGLRCPAVLFVLLNVCDHISAHYWLNWVDEDDWWWKARRRSRHIKSLHWNETQNSHMFPYVCPKDLITNFMPLLGFGFIVCFTTTFLHTQHSLLAKLGRCGWLKRMMMRMRLAWRKSQKTLDTSKRIHQNKTRCTGNVGKGLEDSGMGVKSIPRVTTYHRTFVPQSNDSTPFYAGEEKDNL